MSTKRHPITPPPELRCQWQSESPFRIISVEREDYMIDRAAQWAADQEMEECIDVLGGQWEWDALGQCTDWKEFRDLSERILRSARRPQPPTLKERLSKAIIDGDEREALKLLEELDDSL